MARTEKQIANLIPIKTLTKEQAKKRGAAGGKASAEAKKKRKTLVDTLKTFLDMQAVGGNLRELEKYGFEDDNTTNQVYFAVSVFKNGCNGNTKAMEMIAEIIDGDKKKELEIERQKQEIERLTLECEKLRREMNVGADSYEDLTPLAEKLNWEDDE